MDPWIAHGQVRTTAWFLLHRRPTDNLSSFIAGILKHGNRSSPYEESPRFQGKVGSTSRALNKVYGSTGVYG